MIKSFKHAFHGLGYALKEKTFRILCAIASVTLVLAVMLEVTLIERAVIVLTIMVVLSFELLNTQVEKTLNIIQPKTDVRIKMIKDISAAAVLIASVGSVLIGFLIFLPYLV